MSYLRRLLSLAFSPRPSPPSDSSARGRIERAYRAWAGSHAMRVSSASGRLRISGRIDGRDVVVDPGIDGAHPGWVQITVGVALSSITPALVTRATRASSFAVARLRALFDDRDLGPELRALTVGARHVRMRLAPGASPLVIEHAVRAVAEVMRTIHAAPESEPRHSCTTTLPYPS